MSKITLLLCTIMPLFTSNVIAQNRKPNIILIYIDDMGYGDIGITGVNAYQTPNFNQLQKEGIIFTQFYSPQAVCTTSRAGLLTGSYPNRIGFSGALDHMAKIGLNPGKNRRPSW